MIDKFIILIIMKRLSYYISFAHFSTSIFRADMQWCNSSKWRTKTKIVLNKNAFLGKLKKEFKYKDSLHKINAFTYTRAKHT